MTKEIFRLEGVQELEDVFKELTDDFGPRDGKRILLRGIKRALQPVLLSAKAEVAKDTGALAASLQVEARRVTSKDRGSKYIDQRDDFIGAVTTASGRKLANIKFVNLKSTHEIYKTKRKAIKQVGMASDGRAIALEFGTAKRPARPFLRQALESNSAVVAESLGQEIKVEIEKYKARKARKLSRLAKG